MSSCNEPVPWALGDRQDYKTIPARKQLQTHEMDLGHMPLEVQSTEMSTGQWDVTFMGCSRGAVLGMIEGKGSPLQSQEASAPICLSPNSTQCQTEDEALPTQTREHTTLFLKHLHCCSSLSLTESHCPHRHTRPFRILISKKNPAAGTLCTHWTVSHQKPSQTLETSNWSVVFEALR